MVTGGYWGLLGVWGFQSTVSYNWVDYPQPRTPPCQLFFLGDHLLSNPPTPLCKALSKVLSRKGHPFPQVKLRAYARPKPPVKPGRLGKKIDRDTVHPSPLCGVVKNTNPAQRPKANGNNREPAIRDGRADAAPDSPGERPGNGTDNKDQDKDALSREGGSGGTNNPR